MRNLKENSMKKILFILSLGLLLHFNGLSALAATFESTSFSVTPENPTPGGIVRIVLQSYSQNLDQSKIAWYINSKKTLEGTGKKELVTTIPISGAAISIRVVVTEKNKQPVEETLTVRPASLDLLWETVDSYTPAFYKGKAFPGEESVVRVIAMPSSQDAVPKSNTTSYQWVKNDSNMPDVSGTGRNVYTIKLDPFNNSENISVTTSGGSVGSGQANVSVTPTQGDVLLYEINPLYGPLYNKVLNQEISPNGKEVSLVAEPFFFSPNNKWSGTLLYAWLVNGFPVGAQTDPTTLTLRGGASTQASTNVTLEVRNSARSLQAAGTSLKINFK